jgi:pyridoxal phosphate enzyme (YggS family)
MGGYDSVSANVSIARERVAVAASRAGRDPKAVELMAVTKLHPVEAVLAAYDAGIRVFGESRVQEALGKFPAFLAARPDARLELIGRLQSNKAGKAVHLFSRVHSVDSEGLLRELDRRAVAEGRRLEVLLELHTGEASKAGFRDLEALFGACELLAGAPSGGLWPRGLMTMAPFTDDPGPIRAAFRALRAAHEAVRARFSFPRFDVLSMGMSNDYEIAVEEGSTLLRLGTALFGSRAP